MSTLAPAVTPARDPGPRRRVAPLTAIALLAALGAAAPARAGFDDHFGYSSRAMGLGNAMVAAPADATAVFYNPGALGPVERSQGQLGFVYGLMDMKPVHKATGERVDSKIDDPAQAVFGAVVDLSPDFGRTRFGLLASLPASGFSDSPIIPPDQPQYVTHTRTQEPMLAVALAYPVTDWLSVGVGVSAFLNIGLGINFGFPVELRSSEGALLEVGIPAEVESGGADVPYRFAPVAGVLVTPRDDLRLGLSLRETLELPFGGGLRIAIPSETAPAPFLIPIEIEWKSLSRPRQVAGGLAWDATDDLTLMFELTWYNWKDLGITQFSIREQDILAIPLDEDRDLVRATIGQLAVEPKVKNTFVPRVGIEWRAHPRLTTRAGYYYAEGGFSNRSPATNYLEPDRHVIAVSAGSSMVDPMEQGDPGKGIAFDLHLQYQILSAVESPAFRHEGDVLSLGFSGGYTF